MNNEIIPGFDDETDQNFAITLENVKDNGDIIVLHLSGYIDTANSNNFQKRTLKAVEAGFCKLIFKCTSLSYVSSSGIGVFMVIYDIIKGKGGKIVFVDIQPKVYEVFSLLGFSMFFPVKNSLEETVSLLKTEEKGGASQPFPKVVVCPVCSIRLRVSKSGRYRCNECKNILMVDDKSTTLVQDK